MYTYISPRDQTSADYFSGHTAANSLGNSNEIGYFHTTESYIAHNRPQPYVAPTKGQVGQTKEPLPCETLEDRGINSHGSTFQSLFERSRIEYTLTHPACRYRKVRIVEHSGKERPWDPGPGYM